MFSISVPSMFVPLIAVDAQGRFKIKVTSRTPPKVELRPGLEASVAFSEKAPKEASHIGAVLLGTIGKAVAEGDDTLVMIDSLEAKPSTTSKSGCINTKSPAKANQW